MLTKQKNFSERAIILLAVLSFTMVMTVIFFDASGKIHVSLRALYSFLGLITIVVYGLLLVLHAADKKLGVPFNFVTMIYVSLVAASFSFFGLSRLGYMTGLAPVAALLGLLIFTLIRKRHPHIR